MMERNDNPAYINICRCADPGNAPDFNDAERLRGARPNFNWLGQLAEASNHGGLLYEKLDATAH